MNWWSRSSEWYRSAAAPADPPATVSAAQYIAFISYSHKDEAAAKWLHSTLEEYKVPRSLVGRLTAHGVVPKQLIPIFRDKQELAAAEDLGAEIKRALGASACLIVLCSPAAAVSKWTNREIDAFKRARADGCVIAAIVDGEPFASEIVGREHEECFPPALRERYDKRGRPTGKRADPLAADLRDRRDGKRLGALKIAAAILGVGLDDLVQRDHLRRQRRLGFMAAGSLAGMIVTSTLAVTAVQARNEAREQKREAEGLVGFMLGDLKEKLEPLGRLEVLDSVGSRALKYYDKQDRSELTDEALAQRSRALTLIGEIASARGDLSGALSRYTAALAGSAELVRRNPHDPEALFEHAQNVFWVGYVGWQRGELDQATRRFEEYKALADRMAAVAPGERKYRLEQVYADTNLGTLLLLQRRFRTAAQVFHRSLPVSEALAAADPANVDYQKHVTNRLAWLADAYEQSGELEQALTHRERELQLLVELRRKQSGDTDLDRSAVAAHRALGRLLAARREVTGGLGHAHRAVAISDALYQVEPDNSEWLQAIAGARHDLADLQLSTGRVSEAAATIRSGCTVTERLVKLDPSVNYWNGPLWTRCLLQRARFALHQRAPAEALALSRQALLAATRQARPLDKRVLSVAALATESDSHAAMGRQRAAVEAARQAIRAAPASVLLNPRELSEVQMMHLRTGNHVAADQASRRLSAIGYRHPAHLHSGPPPAGADQRSLGHE